MFLHTEKMCCKSIMYLDAVHPSFGIQIIIKKIVQKQMDVCGDGRIS